MYLNDDEREKGTKVRAVIGTVDEEVVLFISVK